MINFYDIEIEKSLIGYILTNGQFFEEIEETLTSEMFYNKPCAIIFDCMFDIYQKGNKIDMLAVNSVLSSTNKINDIGGSYVLAEISSSFSGIVQVSQYAFIIREHYIKREAYTSSLSLQNELKSGSDDVDNLIEKHIKEIEKASGMLSADTDIKDMDYATKNAVQVYFDKVNAKSKGETFGINTSINSLNRLTGGWQNSWFCIIGARPKMGKTTFILQAALACAESGKTPVVFSLEMSELELTNKLILSKCDVNNIELNNAELSQSQEDNYLKSADIIKQLPILIDDRPNITVQKIRSISKRLKKKGKCDAIFVDYLQLMSPSKRNNNTVDDISEMSRGLKLLAKELNVPVIALSQLSRKCEERANKMPTLSDLRGSGAIEQDADIICFMMRPSFYGIMEWDGNNTQNLTVFNVAAFRHGGTGEFYLYNNNNFTKFTESKDEAPF